jgi:hypothetical protein
MLFTGILLSIAAVLAPTGRAQSDAADWQSPVNLSQSGSAAEPVVIPQPSGLLRIIWWDQLDGLRMAEGMVGGEENGDDSWTRSRVPILLQETVLVGGEQQVISTPVGSMPHIVGDSAGRAHAFWLGAAAESGERPLLYSRLGTGTRSWSTPFQLSAAAVAFDASADITGTLHLAYVLPVGSGQSPVGLYYQRSGDGGETWNPPVAVEASRYFRLIPQVRLTAGNEGTLVITWRDPQQQALMVTRSADAGASWQAPQPYLPVDEAPSQGTFIAIPGGPRRLAWVPAGDDDTTLGAAATDDSILLSAWHGTEWAATQSVSVQFQDPETGGPVSLSSINLALSSAGSGDGNEPRVLVATGIDQNDDVWLTSTPLAGLLTRIAGNELSAGASSLANLSHSGSASEPAIVARTGNALHVFWWDQFDGLMIADGRVQPSTIDQPAVEIRWLEPRHVLGAMRTTPRLLVDTAGQLHAFWFDAGQGESQDRQLLYSRLASDTSTWLPPMVIAPSVVDFDVQADGKGRLHLAYLSNIDLPLAAPGAYYRRLDPEAGIWSPETALHESRYYRLLTPDTAHIEIAASASGEVFATWDEPRAQRALLARSPDDGEPWQPAVTIGNAGEQPEQGQLVAPPEGAVLLLWKDGRVGETCQIYQALAAELAEVPERAHYEALSHLDECPENVRVLPAGDGRALLLSGLDSDALSLALWDGTKWSERKELRPSFHNLETGQQVILRNADAILSLADAGEGADGEQWLVVVGTDAAGDVWAAIPTDNVWDMVSAVPSPWSDPVSIDVGEGAVGQVAMTSTGDGHLHLLWSQEEAGSKMSTLFYSTASALEQWALPQPVLQSVEGSIREPSLVSIDDQLHAVWSNGHDGKILYSRSFVRDAALAEGWTEPAALPAPSDIGSKPDIVASKDKMLHVVYAVPTNEARGIYYTSSADGGESWSMAKIVFDAAAESWPRVDAPQLAVGPGDILHCVWLRTGAADDHQALAILYARSTDGGMTWSEPDVLMLGAYGQLDLAATGAGLHVVANETIGGGTWHRWSRDGGTTWLRAQRISDFERFRGQLGVLSSAPEVLHLAGVSADGTHGLQLVYAVWDGQGWEHYDPVSIDQIDSVLTVVGAASPLPDRMDLVLHGQQESTGGTVLSGLWHVGRALPAVQVEPLPTWTPVPQPTVTPTPTATPSPVPDVQWEEAPPSVAQSEGDVSLPVLLAAGLAGIIVLGVLGVRQFLVAQR